jgi:hypothetical protein
MPTASHLRNLKQALGTCRGALEEFESALLEFESALLELEETPDENGEAPKRSPNGHNPRPCSTSGPGGAGSLVLVL